MGELPLFLLPNNDRPMKRPLFLMLFFAATAVTLAQPDGRSHGGFDTFVTDTPMVHDPVMAFENGRYYLFSTGHGIRQMVSFDRRSWTVSRHPALDSIPAWTRDSVPGFAIHVWAPDIIRWHGRWWMAYSCSTFGKNTSAIGLMSRSSLSDSVGWKDEGPLVCSREGRDNGNAIDPNFIIDEHDRPWLVWGSFWDGIQLVRLDSTLHIASGEHPHTIARRYAPSSTAQEKNPTSEYAGPNAIEAPFIFRHGGYYYLFVSWDYCCRGTQSSYRVAVGRSKTIEGPYIDESGRDMLQGGGTVLVEGDKKTFEALGHCAAYHFADGDLFICHGYSVEKQGTSVLVQRRMEWKILADGTDWPVLVP